MCIRLPYIVKLTINYAYFVLNLWLKHKCCLLKTKKYNKHSIFFKLNIIFLIRCLFYFLLTFDFICSIFTLFCHIWYTFCVHLFDVECSTRKLEEMFNTCLYVMISPYKKNHEFLPKMRITFKVRTHNFK